MARKASESNHHHHHHSPYQQMINSMAEVFKKMKENTIPPSEIAEVILQAVTQDNPEFRYVIGKDATMLIEMRKCMSDREFENMMKKQFPINTSQ